MIEDLKIIDTNHTFGYHIEFNIYDMLDMYNVQADIRKHHKRLGLIEGETVSTWCMISYMRIRYKSEKMRTLMLLALTSLI